jgi:hypothetical protein
MKLKGLILGLLIVLRPAAVPAAETPPATPATAAPVAASGPQIQFDSLVYNFDRVDAGEMVKHVFTFTNTGDALLVISNVQPSCGCTTAGAWSKEVEPGKGGTVPIQFNSSSYSGPVTKTVTVTCNDKKQPSLTLQIKGTVWRAIDVTPQNAVMNIAPEASQEATTTLRILNNTSDPLTLEQPQSDKPAFTAELKTVQPGKEFQLIVKTVPPIGPGNVQGTISLKTSSTNTPVLKIIALAIIQPVVSVVPPQVFLAAGALSRPLTSVISIRNNGKEPLQLSDAVVNAPGVDVQLKETQPGRQFTVNVTFPAGFEVPNDKVALTMKSSRADFKEIRVPIYQARRPVNVLGASAQTNQAAAVKTAGAH